MTNQTIKIALKNTASAIVLGAMLLPTAVLADSAHDHNESAMSKNKHMSEHGQANGKMNHGSREVMGAGRINKVMADKHMINIVHEPIAELEWPKMRMNFKTTDDVNLGDLKPGQEVTFKLSVKKDNSYVIKQIDVKQ